MSFNISKLTVSVCKISPKPSPTQIGYLYINGAGLNNVNYVSSSTGWVAYDLDGAMSPTITAGLGSGYPISTGTATTASIWSCLETSSEFAGSIVELICYQENLVNVDVTKLVDLSFLLCNYGNLTTLDISANTKLIWIDVVVNPLTTLDVSNNPLLEGLSIDSTQISSLPDLSNNPNLTYLSCGGTPITTIDVSNKINLDYIACANCPLLESLDVSGCTGLISGFDINGNDSLTYVNVSNSYVSGNVSLLNDMYTALNPTVTGVVDVGEVADIGDVTVATDKGWTVNYTIVP